MSLVDCSKVIVQECKYGVGVFASVDISKGDLVEKGLVKQMDVDPNENPYVFSWNEDNTKWVVGLGCLTLYNHSESPNVKVIKNFENETIEVFAIKDIVKGEELTHLYKGRWRECFQDLDV